VYKHILLPTDGSDASKRAIAAGVKLAQALGAKVTGFCAAPPATPLLFRDHFPSRYATTTEGKAVIARAAAAQLAVVERAARAAGVPCESVVVTSDFPAEAIIETAAKRKCDLIVMASHSRRGLAKLVLGSQTQKVLALGKTPVLVHR
jgi:nucleotide-binding universal stress UspA family protein